MTRPTNKQMDEFDYPHTWPEVAGYSLAKFGAVVCALIILLAMVIIEFYYLQASNKRGEELARQMMACVSEFTATQKLNSEKLNTLHDTLSKHQGWEEKCLDVAMPKLDRIETAIHQK